MSDSSAYGKPGMFASTLTRGLIALFVGTVIGGIGVGAQAGVFVLIGGVIVIYGMSQFLVAVHRLVTLFEVYVNSRLTTTASD